MKFRRSRFFFSVIIKPFVKILSIISHYRYREATLKPFCKNRIVKNLTSLIYNRCLNFIKGILKHGELEKRKSKPCTEKRSETMLQPIHYFEFSRKEKNERKKDIRTDKYTKTTYAPSKKKRDLNSPR